VPPQLSGGQMMLAGSPGKAQINRVMIAGTARGRTTAASSRTAGLNHHRFTRGSRADRGYFS
jgi:hypothetical protein